MAPKKATKFNFEDSLKQLETIVNSMERDILDLDTSLKTFADGVLLTQKCQAALKAAEQKVQILSAGKLVDFAIAPETKNGEKEEEEGILPSTHVTNSSE